MLPVTSGGWKYGISSKPLGKSKLFGEVERDPERCALSAPCFNRAVWESVVSPQSLLRRA